MAKGEFEAFVLASVIIPDSQYPKVDEEWKGWKRASLGSEDKLVHEPDVRHGRGPFFFEGDVTKRVAVVESL